jgi:hypothetical protein
MSRGVGYHFSVINLFVSFETAGTRGNLESRQSNAKVAPKHPAEHRRS